MIMEWGWESKNPESPWHLHVLIQYIVQNSRSRVGLIYNINIKYSAWDCDCIISNPNGFLRNHFISQVAGQTRWWDETPNYGTNTIQYLLRPLFCILTQFLCRCLYEHYILTLIRDLMIKGILCLSCMPLLLYNQYRFPLNYLLIKIDLEAQGTTFQFSNIKLNSQFILGSLLKAYYTNITKNCSKKTFLY